MQHKKENHKILLRQLKKLELSFEKRPQTQEEWEDFLERVNAYYHESDEDRYLLERSLKLSSEEMLKKNQTNKKMSLQLVQSAKLASLGTLASGIAHELNNPLSGILGNAQLLEIKGGLNERQEKSVKSIIKLSERMSSVIKNLLKLSRQSDDIHGDPMDISSPVNDCLELLQKQFYNSNIVINFDQPEIPFYVNADRNTLAGVFQNFFTNSYDAFLDNRVEGDRFINITIKPDEECNFVQVIYEDNAGGMPNDILNKIFDPFFTTKGVNKGTGLGMAISKQVIEELGGKIEVETKVGEGTKFVISLKREEQSVEAGEIEKPYGFYGVDPGWEPLPGQKRVKSLPKVLVIDDEAFVCDYFSELLREKCEIYLFQDPVKAIKIMQEMKFDHIVTDINMPKISGFEVGLEIRKYQPQAQLIFISGHLDFNYLEGKMKKFAPYKFIQKPFPSPRSMVELIFKNEEEEDIEKVAI